MNDANARGWRQKLRPWLPALAYMLLIFIISSFEVHVPAVSRLPLKDKLVHFIEYAVLGALCTYACLETWPRKHPGRTVSLGAFLASAFGVSDEIHQAAVPGRSSDIQDVYADAVGAVAGAIVMFALYRRYKAWKAARVEVAEDTTEPAPGA